MIGRLIAGSAWLLLTLVALVAIAVIGYFGFWISIGITALIIIVLGLLGLYDYVTVGLRSKEPKDSD